MKRQPTTRLKSFVLMVTCSVFAGANWEQFRGPNSAGVAPNADLPLQWSEKENIAWKASLPGRGPSSPIVVNDRVFVTCSDGVRQDRLFVVAFDAKQGKELWRRQFWATGRTLTHPVSANAAPTPASDGQRVFAFYSSNDLACLDLDGNLLWYRGLAHDFPKAGNDVGMSASPVVAGDTVIVQVENFGDSFAAGIDTATGETRWRVARPQRSNWCSPAVLRNADGKQLVLLQSGNGLTAHDPRTGEQVWKYDVECAGIPSVVGLNNRIYLPAKGITVLDLSKNSAPEFLWETNQLNPGNSSPIIDGDRVYVLNRGGVLSCGDAATGKSLWQLRVGGTSWATPVIAGGHMYCVDQAGKAAVVKLGGEKGEIVGESEFGESIQSSPAVAGNGLFVRSDKHLWKVAK